MSVYYIAKETALKNIFIIEFFKHLLYKTQIKCNKCPWTLHTSTITSGLPILFHHFTPLINLQQSPHIASFHLPISVCISEIQERTPPLKIHTIIIPLKKSRSTSLMSSTIQLSYTLSLLSNNDSF